MRVCLYGTSMVDANDLLNADDSYTTKSPPPAAFVTWVLAQGDTRSNTSPLHRLGSKEFDASPGHHTHDGRNSRYLFDPAADIITGDLATLAGQRTAIKGILTALKKLGLTDNTTN